MDPTRTKSSRRRAAEPTGRRAAEPTGRRLGTTFGTFLLLVSLTASTTPPAQASWVPERIGGSFGVGYETRPLGSDTRPIDPALGIGDGRFWFAPAEDVEGMARLWSRWKFRTPLGKSKVQASFLRRSWAEGNIFQRDVYGLDISQTIHPRIEFGASVEYSPQIYLRHRGVRNPGPGELRFRPETYRSTEAEAEVSLHWGEITTSFLGELDIRDENDWFNERDRFGKALGFGLDWSPVPTTRLRPFYLRAWTDADPSPNPGSNRSHTEHELGLRLSQTTGNLGIDLYGKLSWRRYTTTDTEDTSRFGREDTIRYASMKVHWKTGSFWRPFVSFDSSGRTVYEVEIAENEPRVDGEHDRRLWRIGIDLEKELSR